jgi:hypothetical protein
LQHTIGLEPQQQQKKIQISTHPGLKKLFWREAHKQNKQKKRPQIRAQVIFFFTKGFTHPKIVSMKGCDRTLRWNAPNSDFSIARTADEQRSIECE